MKKVLSAIFLALIAFIVAISVSKSSEILNVYGYDVSKETESIGFDGSELDNVDSIAENLRNLKKLKVVSLGDFPVDVEEESKLHDACPEVDFKMDTYVVMYDNAYFTTVDHLDFSAAHIEDVTPLYENLVHLPLVKTVLFNESDSIPIEEKEKLIEKYPDCSFEVLANYDVFGQRIREDAVSLDLRESPIDAAQLKDILSLFENLSQVDLTGQSLSYEVKLDLMKTFPDVTFIWQVPLLDKTYDSRIEILDLEGIYLADKLDEIRAAIPLFNNLKKVDMSDCGISNEEMAKFRDEIKDTKIVWRIDLGCMWSLKTDQIAFSVLIYVYGYPPMTTADIQVLKYCNELQALDLGHQAISDISVLGEYCKELRILILADNNLTDLSPLANLPHLHYLEFFVNNVTDLTPLASCKELVDLNISYNHSLSDITPLLNLPRLERLWLESCPVSAEDVQLLRDTYPYATIVNIGQGSIDMGWRTHDRYFAMINMFLYDHYTVDPEFSKYD